MTITPGTGLIINVTYDSSVDGAPSGVKAAVAAAVLELESIFTNRMTVTVAVGFGEVKENAVGIGTLGASISNKTLTTYAAMRAALPLAGFPTTDPTYNGAFYVTNAEARAIGITPTETTVPDGYIGVSNFYTLTVDPNNRAVSSAYDAVGIAEHEITEVMGRRTYSGAVNDAGRQSYAPLDLFRYQSPGVRQLAAGVGYFSTDGVTMGLLFNDPASGGDGGDWDRSINSDAFGVGYPGLPQRISTTDIAVMQALGYTTIASGPGPGTGLFANFSPAGGIAQTVAADNAADATLVRSLLSGLPAAGVLQVTNGGPYAIDAGSTALIDSAAAQVTVFGGARSGQIVIAGTGGVAFNAGSGSGTVLVAGGDNLISVYPGAGAQNITTGDGNDTISALAGANTISAGAGRNLILAQGGNDLINSTGNDLISTPDGNPTITAGSNAPVIFLGSGAALFNGGAGNATVVVGSAAATLNSSGADQLWMQAGGGLVNSSRADTVIGGAGTVTVNAGAANDFVFAGGGALAFNGGSGASTILGAAAGAANIVGGAGSVIAIAYGLTNFTTGSGAATVAAFGGSATVNAGFGGGAGSGVYLGGPAGHNLLRGTNGGGKSTLIGGGDGDALYASFSAGDVLQAGPGAETLSAFLSQGNNKIYGGPGAEVILLGHGNDQVLAGTGSETITASGFGQALIAFANGSHSNAQILSFGSGQNFISLVGFASGEATRALSVATFVGGSEQLTLSDGTKILFAGVTNLTSANFL